MRVAVVVEDFPKASETFILNQVVGLIQRGVDVEIFAVRRWKSDVQHPSVARHELLQRTHFRGMPSPRIARAATAASRLMSGPAHLRRPLLRSLDFREWGLDAFSFQLFFDALAFNERTFDVIHCHFAYNGERAVQARELGVLSGPILTTFHGIDVNPRRREGAYQRLFASGDLFTANTRFTANRASELGCDRDRIAILPMGLRVKEYRFRERRKLRDEPLRILSVARLVEKKGLEYGIRAVANLAREGFDVEYTIVGDGRLRRRLERLATQLGMIDRINFLGWCDEDGVTALYDAAHIFMLPSVTAANGDREGQGLVLQEAQASGLPVISTHHNGIPDGVVEDISGLLVPERDTIALTQALKTLAARPERWPDMGRAGRQFVETQYDQDVLTDRLLQLYEHAVDLQRPQKRPPHVKR